MWKHLILHHHNSWAHTLGAVILSCCFQHSQHPPWRGAFSWWETYLASKIYNFYNFRKSHNIILISLVQSTREHQKYYAVANLSQQSPLMKQINQDIEHSRRWRSAIALIECGSAWILVGSFFFQFSHWHCWKRFQRFSAASVSVGQLLGNLTNLQQRGRGTI